MCRLSEKGHSNRVAFNLQIESATSLYVEFGDSSDTPSDQPCAFTTVPSKWETDLPRGCIRCPLKISYRVAHLFKQTCRSGRRVTDVGRLWDGCETAGKHVMSWLAQGCCEPWCTFGSTTGGVYYERACWPLYKLLLTHQPNLGFCFNKWCRQRAGEERAIAVWSTKRLTFVKTAGAALTLIPTAQHSACKVG